jgi:hypothetical protein
MTARHEINLILEPHFIRDTNEDLVVRHSLRTAALPFGIAMLFGDPRARQFDQAREGVPNSGANAAR